MAINANEAFRSLMAKSRDPSLKPEEQAACFRDAALLAEVGAVQLVDQPTIKTIAEIEAMEPLARARFFASGGKQTN